jgi:hypothetical protein
LFYNHLQLAGFAPPPAFVYGYWLGERFLQQAGEIP